VIDAMPPAFRAHLAAAIAIEEADGRNEAAAALARHYTEVMPRMREEQLRDPVFAHPLDWARLPRLARALDRLAAVLAEAGVESPVATARDAATLAELYAATHYGGFMPMLYGYPADLAYIVHAAGGDRLAAIDRFLTAPIVHELCHLGRARASCLPIHLDECVGGWLGIVAHPALAYPDDDADDTDAIFCAPWFAQIGQALVRRFGRRATLRAYAGVAGALPDEVVRAAHALADADWRARRSPSFLADPFAPEPWLALTEDPGPDPDADRAIVEDALRAMCLVSELRAGSHRTRRAVPRTVVVDRAARTMTTAHPSALAPSPRYRLPAAVARDATIELARYDDIPAIAASLM